MKIIITEKQLNTLNNEKNSHRYNKGEESPGIEKFLQNPNDETISNGLLSELQNDSYGKGKLIINFNGEEFKVPDDFIFKIQSDFKAGKCYTLTTYEFKVNNSTNLIDFDKYDPSRWILNTEIKMTASGNVCKKETTPKKFCKYKVEIPKLSNFAPLNFKKFKQYCAKFKKGEPSVWTNELLDMPSDIIYVEHSDGTKSRPTSEDLNNSQWDCFAQSCFENIMKYGMGKRKSHKGQH